MKRMIAGLVATALLSCRIDNDAAADTANIWVRADGSNFMPRIVDAFNKSHPDQINLSIIPNAGIIPEISPRRPAAARPDALSLDLIYTPAFAAAGQLEDITDWAKSLPYFDQLSPAHVKTGTYKGRIYGLPYSADSSVLIWNKKLFKQAGLDPEKGPKTWAEIEADAAKVNALGGDIRGFYFSGNCGGCNIFTFTPLIWASGGDILSEDGSKATLDSPQMRGAIDLYRRMIKQKFVPAGAETDTGANFFAALRPARSASRPRARSPSARSTPSSRTSITDHFPAGQGRRMVFVRRRRQFRRHQGHEEDRGGEGIPRLLLLAWRVRPSSANYGSLPVRGDIAKDGAQGSLDPRYHVAAEAMAKGKTPYSVVFNDLINSANGPWTQMVNEAFFGDDVDGSIANAQTTMQSIINSAHK